MHRSRGIAITSLALLFAVFLSRHHVRDLIEMATTYSTYNTIIQHNPDRISQYPALNDSIASQGESGPKIIHRIYLTSGNDSVATLKYADALASCVSQHPSWTHNLWTSGNATDFIRTYYPEILPHYQSYKQNIQRANILRYALLHHYGGVYLDLDVTCRQPLDELLHLPFLTPGAYPTGVNNAFILARSNHPLLTSILEAVPRHNLHWPLPYVENMLSTGCMFFSNQWVRYVRSGQAKGADGVHVLGDQDGRLEAHMLRGKVITPLFEHGGASSWHGWDAAAIVMVGRYYRVVAGVVIGVVLAMGAMIFRCARRRRPSWQGSAKREASRAKDEETGLNGKLG